MKQTERKQDKTPAEPTEGRGRWVCQTWTEEQNKEGANHSRLQRKTYFSTSQEVVGETSVDGWKRCRDHMVGNKPHEKTTMMTPHFPAEPRTPCHQFSRFKTPLKFPQIVFECQITANPTSCHLSACAFISAHIQSRPVGETRRFGARAHLQHVTT